jgi:hypothetical protein
MDAAEHDRVSVALLALNFGVGLIDEIDDVARNDAWHGAILCHCFARHQERQPISAEHCIRFPALPAGALDVMLTPDDRCF